MERSVKNIFFSELMLWLALGGIGAYFLMPLRDTLRFGIDLVGGTYLTLEVQTDKAVEADLVSKLQGLDEKLRAAGKRKPTEKVVTDNVLIATFDSINSSQDAAQFLKTAWTDAIVLTDGSIVRVSLTDKTVQAIKDDAVLRNIEVLRARLNTLGVEEIPISRQGKKNIIVELPDVADPQKAKEMVGRSAKLEFKLVEKTAPTKEDLLFDLDGEVPSDREILPGSEDGIREFYLVEKYAQVDGSMLKSARPALGGRTGVQAVVQFEFNDQGTTKFYELTSKNYNRRLAIVLDDRVISSPTIQSAIRGSGEITGNFTSESARTLALLLKSGAFVAPVTFEEERQIGPSLGQDSIEKGLFSCLAGLGLLFLFSLLYYKLSGLFAFLALVYNLLLVLIGLSWLGATLTLPGIAGMVLTVGMAIDASILIFEHIKEQLKKGITARLAVKHGFAGAMRVILDANITTFIVGIVLYQFGTGPIQGFAVTLMLGIIATLIATLLFLRSLFNFVLCNFNVQNISI